MGKKIMVVDDNPDISFSVKQGLEFIDPSFKIIQVGSGKECLQLLDDNQIPDLILLDIMMPEMTGWELYDHIKEHDEWKNIPVVFLTARTDYVAKNAGQFLGKDYIEKPFEINNLKNRIDKILNEKE